MKNMLGQIGLFLVKTPKTADIPTYRLLGYWDYVSSAMSALATVRQLAACTDHIDPEHAYRVELWRLDAARCRSERIEV